MYQSKPYWAQNLPRKEYKKRMAITIFWFMCWIGGFGYLCVLSLLEQLNRGA